VNQNLNLIWIKTKSRKVRLPREWE